VIAFRVQIGRKGSPRLSFDAMAPDSVSCVMQHMDLCEPDEKLDVMGLEHWREQQRERAALVRQINRPDELARAMNGGML
jgi:hypothetical protein